MNNYLEKKCSYNQISFRYAKGESLATGNEIHSYHEILYYIDGGATFLSANFKEELGRGTLLIIPKEEYHNLRIENQNAYTRFVINFPDMDEISSVLSCVMSEIRIIQNVNVNIMHILSRMCEVICNAKNEDSKIFLYGSLLSLLWEISYDITNAIIPNPRADEHLISKCLKFIEENYTSSISIEDIAKEMYVSPSLLFQCFKNELGVSIYKYITEKRMIYARKLIYQGENPTKIYKECGFSDYSTFYKAYKKMFSLSPSQDKKAN